jgi:hypothetical protein
MGGDVVVGWMFPSLKSSCLAAPPTAARWSVRAACCSKDLTRQHLFFKYNMPYIRHAIKCRSKVNVIVFNLSPHVVCL